MIRIKARFIHSSHLAYLSPSWLIGVGALIVPLPQLHISFIFKHDGYMLIGMSDERYLLSPKEGVIQSNLFL